MRKLNLAQCPSGVGLPGYRVDSGGVSNLSPGTVSHAGEAHRHRAPEIFIILSGRGVAHIDGNISDFEAGDVLIVETGEEHHLEAVTSVVTSWLHMAAE